MNNNEFETAQLITTGALASKLGVSMRYVQKLVKRLEIHPVMSIGRVQIFAPDALEQLRGAIKRQPIDASTIQDD